MQGRRPSLLAKGTLRNVASPRKILIGACAAVAAATTAVGLAGAQGTTNPDDARKRLDSDRTRLEATQRRSKELQADVDKIAAERQRITDRLVETARLIRDKEITYGVPRSQTLVDEDGVGGGVVDSLPGCRGFMGGSSPLPDKDGVYPAVQNLKAQCAYKLAELVQGHKLAVRTEDMFIKERLNEELQQIRRRNEDKDGKLAIVAEDEVKKALGRSPDFADAVLMRAFFELNKEPPKIVEKKPMYQKELEQFQRDRRQTIGKKF